MLGLLNARAFSLKVAARLADSSEGQLRKDIAAGRLIARKNGKRTTILSTDLDAYLQNLPRLGIDQPPIEPPGPRNARVARRERAA